MVDYLTFDLNPLFCSVILSHRMKTQDDLQSFISFCLPQLNIALLLTMISPSTTLSPGFSLSETLLTLQSSWKHPDERKRCFVSQAFLSLLLTHKHSQFQFRPRPVWQDAEPEKQSHRCRAGINICLITLLTFDIFSQKKKLHSINV